jgi:hypothetical protein
MTIDTSNARALENQVRVAEEAFRAAVRQAQHTPTEANLTALEQARSALDNALFGWRLAIADSGETTGRRPVAAP